MAALNDEHVFELAAVPLSDGMIAARQIVELYFDEGEPERVSGTIEQRRAISNPNVYVQAEKEVLPVERVYVSASRQVRDQKLVTSIRRIYKDKCSVCGKALPRVYVLLPDEADISAPYGKQQRLGPSAAPRT
jgi:hypothetical protein